MGGEIHGMGLCAGGGALEVGLELVLGDSYRCVCYVEQEAYAAATLVKRMAEGSLAPAPIWDDLDTFDGAAWRGRVDVISSGFPCQPFSAAGQRRGSADERNLWPRLHDIIRAIRPSVVFLENSPRIWRYYTQAIGPDFQRMGYETEEGIFSAEEVGAPHLRERFFVLAYTSEGHLWLERGWSRGSRGQGEAFARGDGANGAVADSYSKQVEWPTESWTERNPWSTESNFCRVANGVARRVERLQLLGNGVVPLQAAHAFATLATAASKP